MLMLAIAVARFWSGILPWIHFLICKSWNRIFRYIGYHASVRADGRKSYAADDVHTEPHQSYWSFRQGDLLDDLPSGLQNYFLYALGRVPPSVEDPIAYLQKPVDPQLKSKHWPRTREMWSTVSFYHAAGKTLQHRGDTWVLAPVSDMSGSAVFEFIPGRVLIDSNLRTTIEKPASGVSFQILRINDLQNYRQAMLASLHQLLKTMPLARHYQK